MKTINYVIYRSISSWLDTFFGTDKNSLKHATKIHGGQSELSEKTEISKNDCTHYALMHLYRNQSTKQVIFFSKKQPVIRNWMRGQIYALRNSIPVLIIYVKRNLQTKSAWILTLTHLAN